MFVVTCCLEHQEAAIVISHVVGFKQGKKCSSFTEIG